MLHGRYSELYSNQLACTVRNEKTHAQCFWRQSLASFLGLDDGPEASMALSLFGAR